ncbi:MAG TPA: hypothetical protein PLX53_00850, partial [Tenuifilaceae bacterium]|nr:hypothetical protein [Tenuifilaceae bacterium]
EPVELLTITFVELLRVQTCPPTGGFVCVCTLPLLMASPRFAATSNTPAIRYHFIPTRRVQELASCR